MKADEGPWREMRAGEVDEGRCGKIKGNGGR